MKSICIAFIKFEDMHWEKDTQIAIGLQKLGYDVTMLSTKKFTPRDNIKSLILDRDSFLSGEWALNKFDTVILFHLNLDFIQLVNSLKSNNIKTIIKADHHGYFPLFESDIIRKSLYYYAKNIYKAITNLNFKQRMTGLMKNSDYIIIESSTAYRRYVSIFNDYGNKFKLIPNGHHFTEFEYCNKQDTIIAIGRWNDLKQKRIYRLLDAFLFANKLNPIKFKLQIIGSCPDNISDEYRSEYIDFLGKQPKTFIENRLKDSKILLMSSEWEGFANVMAESLSRNNSIVSTPHAGAIDVVSGGMCGMTSEDYTVKSLGKTLLAEMTLWGSKQRNQELIHTIGQKRFDNSMLIKKIEELL
jgi:glycosyltransferase involved in cell wall biosynthesis